MTDPQPAHVALVTGAAGGIGQATVSRLRARGYAIIAEDISRRVEELGADEAIVPLQADVSLTETAQRAVALAQERFGRLDLLVNNAGLFLRKPTEDHSRIPHASASCSRVNVGPSPSGPGSAWIRALAMARPTSRRSRRSSAFIASSSARGMSPSLQLRHSSLSPSAREPSLQA